MSGTKIERYLGKDSLCPLIAALGRSEQTKARESFRPHSHHVVEICLIIKGTVDWWMAGRKFHLAANTVFVTQPGERHGTVRGIIEPCVLTWIQIDQRRLRRKSLRRRLLSLPAQIGDFADRLLPFMDRMLEECRRPRPDSREMIEANLLMLLSLLARQADLGSCPGRANARFQAVREFISTAEEADLSVLDICNHFDLSRSYVHQLFVRHLGMGPKAYLMERKLETAARLLAAGQTSITEIAHRLDFSSSQHFATAFRNHYGMTPSEARGFKRRSGRRRGKLKRGAGLPGALAPHTRRGRKRIGRVLRLGQRGGAREEERKLESRDSGGE